jgi:ectoine hydroxylase-related dioxygenase (phytanoyl-CoA dioxygenase family)
MPWFDRPDALRVLETRRKDERLRDEEFELLRHWALDGYVVVRDLVPQADVDGMLHDLDDVWSRTQPIERLKIEDLQLTSEDPRGMAHSQLVTLDVETRERLRRECRWRVHGFYKHSAATRRIFENAPLLRLSSLIFGRPSAPAYTINFGFGSASALHQDTAVFFVWPMNFLMGAWLACEDIAPESGPLVYYPGSHREPLFAAFDDYPRTQLKTCSRQQTDAYNRHIDHVGQRYERKAFLAKKGEILLWHALLIHGGDDIENAARTRKSYVCHYIPPGCNKEAEIPGPFNW